MLSAADNDLLTLAGPATQLGKYFRRFWLPVALSAELSERDGAPIRVKVLGEDLIAFRTSDGSVGLSEPRCPHRGADLYFGRNELGGIRCIFHGWKFDVGGSCLDMPNAPGDSNFRARVRIKTYPTREFGEMIWAYLGPPNLGAEVPELELGTLPAAHRFVTKKLQQCNWAQSVEGALDTAHFSFLHMPAPGAPSSNSLNGAPVDQTRLEWVRDDPMPRFSIVDHAVGFVIGAARHAGQDRNYWRMTQFMLPSHSTTPSTLPGETYFGYTWVPIDDESCWIYSYAWNPDRPIDESERKKFRSGHGIIPEVDSNYIPIRNRENEYLIDRDDQKHRTYTGIRGIAEQDAMAQDSQGRIADRTREMLTATDAGIIYFRKVILGEIKALANGTEPTAARLAAEYRLRSGSWIADASVSFDEVMAERFGDPVGHAQTTETERQHA
jgi:phthalate 4,5-dioxygenase oxygenase subunit